MPREHVRTPVVKVEPVSYLRGPSQSTASFVTVCVVATIFGALAAGLGTVVHSGGIDGGPWGIVVALAAALAGAATFTLMGGIIGWLFFSLPAVLVVLWLLGTTEFDIIDTGGAMTTWWQVGLPVMVVVGCGVGMGISNAVGRAGSKPTVEYPTNDVKESER